MSHFLFFVLGYLAQTTGSAYLDTMLAYVKLHTLQHRSAVQLEAMLNYAGVPVQISNDVETAKLYGIGACASAWALHRLGLFPTSVLRRMIFPAILAGAQQMQAVEVT